MGDYVYGISCAPKRMKVHLVSGEVQEMWVSEAKYIYKPSMYGDFERELQKRYGVVLRGYRSRWEKRKDSGKPMPYGFRIVHDGEPSEEVYRYYHVFSGETSIGPVLWDSGFIKIAEVVV